MRRALGDIGRLAAILIGGVLIAVLASRTPTPKPTDAAAGVFSATRAMADVRMIAAQPHPMGSEANKKVMNYVAGRLSEITEGPVQVYVAGASVRGETLFPYDLLARWPGRDPNAPALLLMAHYDSTPNSPGGGDDGAGVAAILETLRALKAAGPPLRQVDVLITDGEEAGLAGSQIFFTEPVQVAHIGVVLNLDARGGGGRVYMFETGGRDAADVAVFARAAPNATSNSLAPFLYRYMPNDTDFTLAKRAGLAGLNFAFLGRPGQYHDASATAEALDQGTLQHLGDQVLGVARALAYAPALPPRAGDAVWSDVFGLGLIVYPPWAGWGFVVVIAGALTAGGLALRRRGELNLKSLVWGVAFALAVTLATGLAAHLALDVAGRAHTFAEVHRLFARFDLYETGLALLCLGCALVCAGPIARRGGSAWLGALGFGLELTADLQAFAPQAAFLAAWPLTLASLAFAAWTLPTGRWIAAALATITLGLVLYWGHAIALGIAADYPEALAILTLLAGLVLMPFLRPARLGLVPLALGAAAMLWVRLV